MAKYLKWIGIGLGWAYMGIIGGLIGFALGSFIDETFSSDKKKPNSPGATTQGDFLVSLLVLVAAVMKANGKVMKSEVAYVKEYLIRAFGKQKTSEGLKILKKLLEQNIPINDVCAQIRERLDYSSKLELIHFLFGIVMADKIADQSEVSITERIAVLIGVTSADINSIKSMFVPNTDSAYKILEVPRTATVEEIKKSYRKMAVRYHPDKVSYLGDNIKREAEDKFRKINEAYEKIKKEKGFS